MDTAKFETVEAYIQTFPPETQAMLNALRNHVLSQLPGVSEGIGYQMPAYKWKGKPLVYFAGYKNHLGFYPTSGPLEHVKEKILGFKHSKGAIQFPLDKPLPWDLIDECIFFRKNAIEQRSKL